MAKTDVAIIGAGPVGLFAGFYCGMRSLSVTIIDKLEIPGGRLSALYPEKFIYDVAGAPKIRAQELVGNLTKQLERFDDTTNMILGKEVTNLEKNGDEFVITLNEDEQLEAKSVIIALGSGAFAPRPLGIEGEENYTNLHYFVPDLSIFKDKKVAIFGGGDSAVDWALMLDGQAKEVNLIHRRDEFRAHGHSVEELKKSNVNIWTPYMPEGLVADGDKVKEVTIKNKEGKIETIEVDDIIVNFGFTASLGEAENWGLEIEHKKIKVDTMQRTNLEGVFAIGDICEYPGRAELIVTGFGEGPIAVNAIYRHLNPDAKIGALHSSSVIKE